MEISLKNTSNTPTSKKRILIMAGGTGGHIFPALAVAKVMQKQGFQVEWLGTRRGMEADIVPKAGFFLHYITVTGLRRESMMKRFIAGFQLMYAFFQAFLVIYRFKPHVVLGMGGFASGPGGVAARLLGVPLVIHEQNAIAGVTNCLLATIATRVLEGFPESFLKFKTLQNAQAIYTGNPVREEFWQIPDITLRFEERSGPLNILILGGSQGAKALNELCPEAFSRIPEGLRPFIRHQTGAVSKESTEFLYKNAHVLACVEPFIHDMAEAYAWADLVICRAGALTVAELTAVGVGSILIPFPFAVDDHQTYNGRFLERGEAAQVIAQALLNPSLLADIIIELSRNRQKVKSMALAAKTLAKPDALDKVVGYCIEVMK